MAEDAETLKQEKLAQMKIFASLNFDSYASNQADIEEQLAKPVKKFKKSNGEDLPMTARSQNGGDSDGDDLPLRSEQRKRKEYPKKPEQKRQPPKSNKPPKEVSSNWQKFLAQHTPDPAAQSNNNNNKQQQQQGKQQQQQMQKPNNNQPNAAKETKVGSLEPQDSSFKGVTPIVAIDCEMVSCFGKTEADLPTQELARVSIVNFNGHVLMDSYVRPQKRIRDYLTSVSGITFNLIKNAPTYNDIKEKLFTLLAGKTLVGHSIQHDLGAIKYEAKESDIRDISNYKALRRSGKKVALKKLALQELGVNFQEGQHDSVADARAALLIYKKHQKQIDREQGSRK